MTGPPPPNVVMVVADDLGWGDLSCYGATRVATPSIDALATSGARFVDSHAASSVCTPSRYAILTGRYPWRSPLQAGVLGGLDPSIMAPGLPTLASVLGARGYRTGAFGKWHLGLGWVPRQGGRASAFAAGFQPDLQAHGRDIDYAQPFTDGPLQQGFDRFFGISGSLDMPPYCFLDQDRTVGIPSLEKDPLVTSQRPGLMVEGWADDEVDTTVLREAVAWMSEQTDVPFFAYIATAAPHRPCVPPHFVQGTSRAGPRGDSIHLVDWMVGQVLETLATTGRLENTMVIFTSDNGAPMIYPEDGDVVHHRPNGAWRGQKADAYEGGHRVPLVIRGPGIEAGTVRKDVVSLLDLLPTVAMFTGAIPLSALDGTDILAADFSSEDRRTIGQQAFDGRLSLRRGRHKSIHGSGSGGFSAPVGIPCTVDSAHGQLYDLREDPGELDNLWVDHHDIARLLYRDFQDTTGYEPPVDTSASPGTPNPGAGAGGDSEQVR
ncbi:MAG: arylsulfatase [Arachnia sp.]